MYQVPPPKEPSGCLQTLVISRMIARILLVPLLLIFGGVISVILVVYALATHFLLGIGVILVAVVILSVLARWEYTRVKRELPPADDFDPADPRMR